jgi:hypothetical protein
MFKKLRRKVYRNSPFLRKLWFYVSFIRNNKYIPNFKNPRTFNEKINYRKNNPKNELFSVCADKIAAKEWVAKQIGEEYIIPNYYVGDSITPEKMKEIIEKYGDCVLKTNHDSGTVFMLTPELSKEELTIVCKHVNKKLKLDYGAYANEPWYSNIKPRVFVEQKLVPEKGESDVRDYKFHIFKQKDGTFKALVAVDFDRKTNHNRSFFNENGDFLNLSTFCPNVITKIDKPQNYEKMFELAKKLATPFSYARVDFYNINGKIYFGEMTFAPGSGNSGTFQSYKYDLWMGNLWQGDPSY